MKTDEQNEFILSIMNYVKTAKLKGSVKIEENQFSWYLGDIRLIFYMDLRETTVEYYRLKGKMPIGHFHEDNSEVIKLIEDINCDGKMILITDTWLGSAIRLVDKSEKKKKSRFFVRRYYSI